MKNKYQIFISSTYADLIKEREAITKQILKNYHFPIGMEMFFSSDQTQWSIIKNTIESSDIFLLLIGYRYGSLNDSGISFTEQEYNHAVSTNKPIIVFIKRDEKLLNSIQKLKMRHAKGLSDDKLKHIYLTQFDEDQSRIDAFKNEVTSKRLVSFFINDTDVDVQMSITEKIQNLPMGGWTRKEDLHKALPILEATDAIGLKHIRTGRPTLRDDEEKRSLFQNSTEIKVIQYNGSKFFDNFKNEITNFLCHNGNTLKVLLANRDSVFYMENSQMVSNEFASLDANKNLVDFAVHRLKACHVEANRICKDKAGNLEVKHFNTQLRSPMIIFDNRIAHVTLTYAPGESNQSVEMEVESTGSSDFVDGCVKHYDRIWEIVS